MEALDSNGKSGTYVPKIRPFIDGTARCLTVEEWLAENQEHFEWVD
jgi:hypothetical protein